MDELARFAVLLSGLFLCLHHYTGNRRLSVGVPPRRDHGPAEATATPPPPAVLPVTARVREQHTFRELVAQVHGDLAARDRHAAHLAAEPLAAPGTHAGGQLFDVVCRHAGIHQQTPELPVTVDAHFAAESLTGPVHGQLHFDAELFTVEEAEWFAAHLAHLLNRATADPDRPVADLATLPPEVFHTVTVEWNGAHAPTLADHCLHLLVEEQAALRPGAVAIRTDGSTISYRELNERANRLGRWLRQHRSARPGRVVGVALPRSITQAVAVLAVLKTGASYTPLDPDQPSERLRFITADAAATTILTTATLRAEHHALFATGEHEPGSEVEIVPVDRAEPAARGLPAENLAVPTVPGGVACLIYTSGSTGAPKGVMLTHRGIVNCLRWEQLAYQLGANDRLLHLASPMFSLAALELFGPLCSGGEVVMAPAGTSRDTASIARLVTAHRVTILSVVPSELALLLEQEPSMPWTALRCVVTGADVVPVPLQERFLATCPSVPLINVYGQTEAALDGAYWVCRPRPHQTRVPVGRPILNTQMYILDDRMRPTPVGVPGELYTGGEGVALGYRNRPALTAERFVPDPFSGRSGARLYRTGDVARWLPDGVIEVLGRRDHQVKIRGVRVELEEVEALLRAHPAIYDAAVAVHSGPPPEVPESPERWQALLVTVDPATLERLLAEVE